ncbi:MAG TPA: NUDIX hydrolase [Thermotogota bacterium]|nr:NUDIX hydrolase [Thermotogota bacterium]
MYRLVEEEIDRKTLFRGKILNLRLDHVRLEDGSIHTREIVEHPGAVAILPVSTDGNVCMVRQYRRPIDRPLLEIPAGKLDPGEEPLECALRELKEETGIVGPRIMELGHIFTSPGFCDEKIFLFLALGGKKHSNRLDSDEFLNLEILSWEELVLRCVSGEIEDAKTVAIVTRARSKVEATFSDKSQGV